VTDNTRINQVSYDAKGVEVIADALLIPFHYVFAAKVGEESQDVRLRFDYDSHLLVKSSLSLIALPLSSALGLPLKILSSKERPSLSSKTPFDPLRFGTSTEETLDSPIYARRPGDENHLSAEKRALKEIAALFKKHQIPFWLDCGSCLGVFRHRGVIPWDDDIDVAILQHDHTRAKEALKQLDPAKYQVQDWSNRSRPGTFLRLYVKEVKTLIDIYHFAIDEEKGTLSYILSNEVSAFLPESWKANERRFKVPTPLDLVFPLTPATLDGVEIFVPNKTKEYLQMRYGEDLSPARVYDEKTGKYEKNLAHPYWNSSL
jgi:LicD family protein